MGDDDKIKVVMDDGSEVDLGEEEYWEQILNNDPIKTGYPEPVRHYEIAYERPNQNVEEAYYWYYHQIRSDWEHDIEKIIDTYAASQASSHFGHMQSRISVQQGQVSQYLKGISDMLKGLFQMVRELRILDDRLQFYFDSMDEGSGNKDSSEIVLKGLWVDQVEGGAKNPSSVYGLATNVGFTILPDLFFRMRIKDPKNIDRKIEELKFNEKIKEVLGRKLRQYSEWKQRTFKELNQRRAFMIKYLRQHHETIQLYITWIKPYLRYIRQMQQAKKLEGHNELISSFESTIVEIEFLAFKKVAGDYYSVGVINMLHRTRPEMNYHASEYQHKGPTHTGKVIINIRTYAWTSKQMEAYKKYREREDMRLLSTIDDSIKGAMEGLGDELEKYLVDSGESFSKNDIPKVKKKKQKNPSILDPFVSIFKGFGDIGTSMFPALKSSPKDEKKISKSAQKEINFQNNKNKSEAKSKATNLAWMTFKNYKKGHGMMTPW
ncbi:hypothetical protein BVX95_01315 [archaeon D22]|nr:hypothetical protein BVX95_01315 [archaeon D22]